MVWVRLPRLMLARAKQLRCLLAAPTGRAAKRMEEATGLPAVTLHRLLDLRPGSKSADKTLQADLVVVDEVSMLDVLLDDGREVCYPYASAYALTHAYAATVHRVQGSEFPAVVIVLLTSHATMLGRTLVYTALTRARRLAVFVGQKRALAVVTVEYVAPDIMAAQIGRNKRGGACLRILLDEHNRRLLFSLDISACQPGCRAGHSCRGWGAGCGYRRLPARPLARAAVRGGHPGTDRQHVHVPPCGGSLSRLACCSAAGRLPCAQRVP